MVRSKIFARSFQVLSLVAMFAAGGKVLSAGEYDRVTFGPEFHLGWSPDKSYGVAGGNGVATTVDGARQVAASGGLAIRMNPIPSKFSLGVDLEYIRVFNFGSSSKDVDVSQSATRGTFRFIYNQHGNSEPGLYVWGGPAVAKVKTTAAAFDALAAGTKPPESENTTGFGIGIGTRRFSENFISAIEANIYHMKDTSAGTKFGGTTLELGFSVQF